MLKNIVNFTRFKIVRFGLVGAVFAALDLFSLIYFADFLKWDWACVAPLTFTVLTVIHYFVVIRYVFVSNPTRRTHEIAMSLFISACGLFVNQLVLYFGIVHFLIGVFYSKLASIIVNFFMNYYFRKQVVFK